MIRAITEKLDFPLEAIEQFSADYKGLIERPALFSKFEKAMDRFLNEKGNGFTEDLDTLAQESEIPLHSLKMIFYLAAAVPMKERYDQRGIPEEVYWNSLVDLRCKMMEAHALYGYWGTFSIWFQDFYWCERFMLGRLQYEKRPFRVERYGHIKKGDTVFNCHIPSAGPLTEESVMDSLKKAHAFYRDELTDGILPVVCSTWLLYEPFDGTVFPEGTNLWKFNRMFTRLTSSADPNNGNFWRIFHMRYSPETLKDAPEDTGLRRRMKAYLMEGNTLGSSYGILLFDGDKILPPMEFEL